MTVPFLRYFIVFALGVCIANLDREYGAELGLKLGKEMRSWFVQDDE